MFAAIPAEDRYRFDLESKAYALAVHQPAYGVRVVIQRTGQQVNGQLVFTKR
jgi:hypothetical protein